MAAKCVWKTCQNVVELIKIALAICTHHIFQSLICRRRRRRWSSKSLKAPFPCSKVMHNSLFPAFSSDKMAEYNMSHMVRPQGFSLEELRQTMSRSAIREQCYFIYATGNILEVIHIHIIITLSNLFTCSVRLYLVLMNCSTRRGSNSEQINWLRCMYAVWWFIYSIMRTRRPPRWKELFSCKSASIIWHAPRKAMWVCIYMFEIYIFWSFPFFAQQIHQVCVHVLGLLDIQSSSTMLNLILGCRVASPLCTMASVVANCLLWAMLDHMSDLGLDLHRLRPANTLLLVVAVVKPHIYVISYLHSLHLVVRLISSILLIGPFNAQGQQLCQETDVPEDYMKLARDDCSILVRWLIAIVDELRPLMVENNDLGHLHERLVLLESICELMQLLHGHLVKCYQGKSGPQCK